MPQLMNQRDLIFSAEGVEGQFHIGASVLADGNRVGACHGLAKAKNGIAGSLLFPYRAARHNHRGEAVLVGLARMLPAARESTSLLSAPTAAAKLVFPSSRRPIVRSTAASASQRCARTADLTCKPEPASHWGAGFSRFPVRESWTVLACGKVGFAEQKAGLAFFRAVWYALPVKIAKIGFCVIILHFFRHIGR